MNKQRPSKKSLKGRRLDAEARAARRAARAAKRAAAGMVSPEDVALGRGKNQTYEDINNGIIPAMRFGRCWRIPRAWLDRVQNGEPVAAS